MRVALLTTVARRVSAPGDAFEPIDVLAALPACAKLLRPRVDVRVEFVRVVECRHHKVSTFPPLRVVAVMRNDPAGNRVVVWIHHGHARSIRPPGTRAVSPVGRPHGKALNTRADGEGGPVWMVWAPELTVSP